jgi:hypothetical protein
VEKKQQVKAVKEKNKINGQEGPGKKEEQRTQKQKQ